MSSPPYAVVFVYFRYKMSDLDLLVGGKTNLVMMPARTVLVVIYFELTYSWSHNNNII